MISQATRYFIVFLLGVALSSWGYSWAYNEIIEEEFTLQFTFPTSDCGIYWDNDLEAKELNI